MSQPTIGTWYRVTQGPQRGATGVVDHERTFPTGTFWRLVNPDTKTVVGRFRAESLEPTTAPVYASKVTPAVRQQAMDMLVKRSS